MARAQVYLRIFDLQHRRTGLRGYLPPAAAGYAVGLLLTYAALYFSLFGDQVRTLPVCSAILKYAGMPSGVGIGQQATASHLCACIWLMQLAIARNAIMTWPAALGVRHPRQVVQRLLAGMLRSSQCELHALFGCAGPAGAAVPGALHAGRELGAGACARGPARHVGRVCVRPQGRGPCGLCRRARRCRARDAAPSEQRGIAALVYLLLFVCLGVLEALLALVGVPSECRTLAGALWLLHMIGVPQRMRSCCGTIPCTAQIACRYPR